MPRPKTILVKVYKNRSNGQKLVTIPKKHREIKPGDYVKIIKVRVLEF